MDRARTDRRWPLGRWSLLWGAVAACAVGTPAADPEDTTVDDTGGGGADAPGSDPSDDGGVPPPVDTSATTPGDSDAGDSDPADTDAADTDTVDTDTDTDTVDSDTDPADTDPTDTDAADTDPVDSDTDTTDTDAADTDPVDSDTDAADTDSVDTDTDPPDTDLGPSGICGSDPFEPNDSYPTAARLTVAADGAPHAFEALEHAPGDADFFLVRVPAGCRIDATIRFVDATKDLDLSLHDGISYVQLDVSATDDDVESVGATPSRTVARDVWLVVYTREVACGTYDLTVTLACP